MSEEIIPNFVSFEDFSKKYQLGKIWLLPESDFTEKEVFKMIEDKVSRCQMDRIIIEGNKYWLVNE